MSDQAYEILAEKIQAAGLDLEQIKTRLKNQAIETPSWGYANSGTRFQAFAWPGAAVTTHQKLDDAAMVHKMTGIAPSVALHIPWDVPEDGDYNAMREYAEAQGVRLGAINPNVFQEAEYMLGSFTNPNPAVQEKALAHTIECCEIMEKTGSGLLSLWFADGTNYAGQDNLRLRKERLEKNLRKLMPHLPAGGRALIEYKFFEPGFYSTDIPDWGTSYLFSLKLGEQAQVLIDLGHHPLGTNIEQIVAFLLDEGKMGGFHFNNHRYADDDLMVGSVNPFELFLIYTSIVEALDSNDALAAKTAANIAFMIDQSHNIEGKVAPMIHSVLNCQEAYAKGLLVPWKELGQVQAEGRVLEAHQVMVDTFRTDVRPLLQQVREEMGVPVDPVLAYRESGYEARIAAERGLHASSGGYQ
ncbi:MAG: L-rhamnose isomerase / sugar isomerase [Chloroflexota bacterium]|nr:L-rhamnose isomerase / sugar isomerase [Chloroflexota bacterium]